MNIMYSTVKKKVDIVKRMEKVKKHNFRLHDLYSIATSFVLSLDSVYVYVNLKVHICILIDDEYM